MYTSPVPMAGIARSYLLIDLNIRTYSGRKLDRRTQEEVTQAKGAASKRAASVSKHLFADCKELDDIIKLQARARGLHYQLTQPWTDSGTRILHAGMLQRYMQTMGEQRRDFDALVLKFLDKYETLVAAAAFQLGTLFDRTEYPSRAVVAQRFSFTISQQPMPTSGDFRLDVEAEVQRELIEHYEKVMQDRLTAASKDSWTRLHGALMRISERLTTNEDGSRKRIFDSLVDNAVELCDLLKHFNVAGDPKLESARTQLESALIGVNAEELRKSDGARVEIKQSVDKILSEFDWDIVDDEDSAE